MAVPVRRMVQGWHQGGFDSKNSVLSSSAIPSGPLLPPAASTASGGVACNAGRRMPGHRLPHQFRLNPTPNKPTCGLVRDCLGLHERRRAMGPRRTDCGDGRSVVLPCSRVAGVEDSIACCDDVSLLKFSPLSAFPPSPVFGHPPLLLCALWARGSKKIRAAESTGPGARRHSPRARLRRQQQSKDSGITSRNGE